MSRIYQVAIIGGGISGSVTALQLAKYNVDSVLFEQRDGLVHGPPFCHLHAGGNLYPEISLEQCKMLMRQSVDSARFFPETIDHRPTLIAIPKSERINIQEVENRLKQLSLYYKELITQDPANQVLGPPEKYFTVYTNKELEALVQSPSVPRPVSHDDWLCNALKYLDHSKLKRPLFMVQEYGWNLFRLAAQTQLALSQSDNCDLRLNTQIMEIKDVSDLGVGYNWQLFTKDKMFKANYLVNSSGSNSSKFDSCLQLAPEQIVEFKASYIAKWQPIPGPIPELVFHGERGTPQGMAQLTPYCDNYYQIHGMTNEITLFRDGLIRSGAEDVFPEFNDSIKKKINGMWDSDEVQERTLRAIDFIARFVPSFETATVGGPPLYGAQQIPGRDSTLRVGDVTFPHKFYARSQIVKASTALASANHIIENMQQMKLIPAFDLSLVENSLLESIGTQLIDSLAADLATHRGYPAAMSKLLQHGPRIPRKGRIPRIN
ncbi:MAG: FAD-dependent oxidoreductase [Rikenellaceae bacterium]|nr:FAD-dependent oxidoreductase [Rikenellaceae bacterium]